MLQKIVFLTPIVIKNFIFPVILLWSALKIDVLLFEFKVKSIYLLCLSLSFFLFIIILLILLFLSHFHIFLWACNFFDSLQWRILSKFFGMSNSYGIYIKWFQEVSIIYNRPSGINPFKGARGCGFESLQKCFFFNTNI